MRIDASTSLYDYGSYQAREIPKVSVEEIRKQDEQKQSEMQALTSGTAAPVEEPQKASKIARLEDISLSFQKEDDYSYIGKDRSLMQLDMQKAISDMKRDSILEEYQYFVGNSNPIMDIQESPEGIVIPKLPNY